MMTTAELRKRLESLEHELRTQETKIFFVDEGLDQALNKTQWEVVKIWEQAHVIVFEKVGPE